jgi:hypothetical protein
MREDLTHSLLRRVLANPLWLLPAALLGIVLAGFFFALFLAIFAVAAVVLGLRFYWWRRARKQSGQTLEGDYIVIEKRKLLVHRGEGRSP